jgi:PAS domain-containing protein
MAGMEEIASSPPFGMSPALPAFHRATRIAEALFGGEASVMLVDGERVWRSGGSLVGTETPATGARYVIDRGDRSGSPTASPIPRSMRRTPPARFWAGAPVRLADGATIGVLTVMSRTPRAYDEKLAARLQDLADSVADECERARAAETAAQRDASCAGAQGDVGLRRSVPIESVMTDRDLRVLTATPRWLETFGLSPRPRPSAARCKRFRPTPSLTSRTYFERCLAGEVVRDPGFAWLPAASASG